MVESSRVVERSSRMMDYYAPPKCYTFGKVQQEFGLSLGLTNLNKARTVQYNALFLVRGAKHSVLFRTRIQIS